MTRTEFMKQLQDLLSDISKNEREEALQYYNDYFDDAGPEEEARILTELGSPEQVARKIKAGLSDDASEFSEQGYRDTRFDGNEAAPAASSFMDSESAGKTAPKKERNLWKLLAIVLLCIVLGPFVIPVGFGLLAVLFCVLLAALLTVAAVLVSGVVIFVAGIFVIGVGLIQLFTAPVLGIATAGAGCLLTALGILLSLALLWIALKVVPVLVQGLVNLVRLPFRKAGVIR